jgi:hypothetical protein
VGSESMAGQRIQKLWSRRDHMLVPGSLPVSAIAATHSPVVMQGRGTAGTPAGVSHREHVSFASTAGHAEGLGSCGAADWETTCSCWAVSLCPPSLPHTLRR